MDNHNTIAYLVEFQRPCDVDSQRRGSSGLDQWDPTCLTVGLAHRLSSQSKVSMVGSSDSLQNVVHLCMKSFLNGFDSKYSLSVLLGIDKEVRFLYPVSAFKVKNRCPAWALLFLRGEDEKEIATVCRIFT